MLGLFTRIELAILQLRHWISAELRASEERTVNALRRDADQARTAYERGLAEASKRADALEAELNRAHGVIAKLESQIRMVMEERFYRPVVTGTPRTPTDEQPAGPEIAPDVNVYEPEADARWMQEELAAIAAEHAEWKSDQEGTDEPTSAE